jgi:Tfp pilus assembly protein FimT
MLKCTVARLSSSPRGFSLIDTMLTVALVGTMAAVAVPSMTSAIDGQRLGIDAQSVQREMQLARLAAVSTNRPIRVRFNCPSVGYYRRVELIGSVNNPNTGDDADNQAARRCNPAYYPFPAADSDPLSRPNSDGPTAQLNSKVSFGSTQTLEFWPNGTVHVYSSTANQPWPQMGSTPVNILLVKGATTRSITVNSLGKMQIQ